MFDPTLFRERFRIASARLPGRDYGIGDYFVTICTYGRTMWFGDIRDKTLYLSEMGWVANECWMDIPRHFPHVELGEFVVMPNHVHGIILIRDDVETQNFASLQPGNRFGPQSRNLASIVRGYKIGVTKLARQIDPNFHWQPRFHDRIIRDDDAMERVAEYIRINPMKWPDDRVMRGF